MNCTELNMRGRRCLARDSKKVITSGWVRLLTSGQPGWFVTLSEYWEYTYNIQGNYSRLYLGPSSIWEYTDNAQGFYFNLYLGPFSILEIYR